MLNNNNDQNTNNTNNYDSYSLPTVSFPSKEKKNTRLRIEPTNLSYGDLLRKHQFTANIARQKECVDEVKMTKMSKLEIERETFPKKSISGYELFASWKRSFNPESKALSIAWNELSEHEKDEWIKKSQQAKQEYIHLKAKTKSVKPMIGPIKIKNLLNLIPNISKFNKETQFIMSKATEMFIQFYASKAIEISNAVSNNSADTVITGRHCYDALQTQHKLNFVRAVTVSKKRKNNKSNQETLKKKRKITKTNQIITNHDEFTTYPSYPRYQYPYHQYPIYQQYPQYQVPPNPFHNVNVERIQSPNTQIVNVQQIFGGDE